MHFTFKFLSKSKVHRKVLYTIKSSHYNICTTALKIHRNFDSTKMTTRKQHGVEKKRKTTKNWINKTDASRGKERKKKKLCVENTVFFFISFSVRLRLQIFFFIQKCIWMRISQYSFFLSFFLFHFIFIVNKPYEIL